MLSNLKGEECRIEVFHIQPLTYCQKVDDEYDDETDAHTNDVKERFAPHLQRLVLQ